MRLQIGDKVTIKKNLQLGGYSNSAVISDMLTYAGKTAIITHILPHNRSVIYKLNIDNANWSWSEDMFEEFETMKRLQVGDKVKIREDLTDGQKYDTIMAASEMEEFRGKICKITYIVRHNGLATYSIDADDNKWTWTIDMFEPIKKNKSIHKL